MKSSKETMKKLKLINKFDLVIIAVSSILAVALMFVFNSGKHVGQYAEVYLANELVVRIDLQTKEERLIKIKDNLIIKVFNDGSVAVVESDCPDKICLKTGKIKEVGQSIVCVPNRLLIVIVGSSDVDVVI